MSKVNRMSTAKSKPMIGGRALALALTVALSAALLPGCLKVGPDYARPKIDMPAGWRAEAPADKAQPPAGKKAAEDLTGWWKRFNDPVLDQLIARALAHNLDLKEAKARVRQVRAQRRVTRSDLWPGLSASGSGTLSQSRDNDLNWKETRSFGLGMDVSWEADLFGGNKRGAEAAQADLEAAEEEARGVRVSLIAETATAYIQLRTYQRRLAMARENLRLQQQTMDLTSIQFRTGLSEGLDLEKATYGLETTRSKIPDLETGLIEVRNRLAVLLGSWPGELDAKLAAEAPIPLAGGPVAVGVPADLLRRRPDIRQAERKLAAQTARIGAAEAEMYPKIGLSASGGWQAATLSGLITPAAMVAALGGGLSWSIFNWESVRGNIEVQTALQEQALLQYEAALRGAVEEVENAITGVVKEENKRQYLDKAVTSAQAAAKLSLQGYETGISDFQSVLETQQSLTSLQDSQAQSQGQEALNLVVLYKTLGGGWRAEGLPSLNPGKQPAASAK